MLYKVTGTSYQISPLFGLLPPRWQHWPPLPLSHMRLQLPLN